MDFQKYGAWTLSHSGEIPNKDEFDVLAWVNHANPPSKKSRETSHALRRPNWRARRYVGVGVFLYWFIYLANINTVLLVFCGICVFQIATCIGCSVSSQKHFRMRIFKANNISSLGNLTRHSPSKYLSFVFRLFWLSARIPVRYYIFFNLYIHKCIHIN